MGYGREEASTERVIIFDWDDTICPSSYFDRQKIDSVECIPTEDLATFREIAKCAEKCLREASKYGEVLIITNSDDGWVKYSCERIVPLLLPALEKYKIVSARTNYEKFYPGQPLCWKAAAFAHEANETFQSLEIRLEEMDGNKASRCPSLELSDVSSEDSFDDKDESTSRHSRKLARPREIISFGDSMEERTAVRIVSDQLNSTAKSVMFVQSPTPVQIMGQLQMLTNQMKFVCEHALTLDLEIDPDEAQAYAESYKERQAKRRLDAASASTTP